MILYCDFNPKLVREYEVDGLKSFGVNTAENTRYYISGNGIDSLEFTLNMQEKAKLIGFYGGNKGDYIKSRLREMNAENISIKLMDESVEELVLKEKLSKTVVRTKSPRITLENIEDFVSIFASELEKADMVVLNETDQENLDSDLYELLVKMCYSKGVNVAVVYHRLQNVKKAKPYIISFNRDSLSDYIGLKVSSEKEILVSGRHVIENGAAIAIICDINGFYVFTKESSLKVSFNEIIDYVTEINENLLLSAMAIAFEREYDFNTSIKLAAASAIAENFIKFRLITMADIKKMMNNITITEVN